MSREVQYLAPTFKELIVWSTLGNAQINYLEQDVGKDFSVKTASW